MTEQSRILRPVVRDVMKMAPEREWSLKALHSSIRGMIPDAGEVDVDAALTWNYGQGHVGRRFNHELECDVWKLTERGKSA